MKISNVVKSPADSRDFVYVCAADVALPDSMDLRSFAGSVEHQGQTGSCVANATVSAMEILLTRAGKFENLSRLFQYWNLREGYSELEGKDGGSYPRDAFKVANKIGICDEVVWPFDSTKVNTKPDEQAYSDAASTKAYGYYSIPIDSSEESRSQALRAVKSAVASGYPVLVSAMINKEFQLIRSAAIEDTRRQFANVVEPIGGHAMLIVGYKGDDLLIENSWGTSWGCAGYALLDGKAFFKDVFELWVCTGLNGEALPALETPIPLELIRPAPPSSNKTTTIMFVVVMLLIAYFATATVK